MTREEQEAMRVAAARRMEELEFDDDDDDEMLDACKLFIMSAGGYTGALLLLMRCAQEESFGDWSSGYETAEFASVVEMTLLHAHTAPTVKRHEMPR